MNLIWKRDPNRQVHRCNVCGNTDYWSDTWRYKMILVGKGINGYEIDFKICSDECLKEAEDKKLIEEFKRSKNARMKLMTEMRS